MPSVSILLIGSASAEIKQQIAEAITASHGAAVQVAVAPATPTSSAEFMKLLATSGVAASFVAVDDAKAACAHGTSSAYYRYRYVWLEGASTVAEAAADIFSAASGERLPRFASSRRATDVAPTTVSFLDAIREGLAADGGLYTPLTLPVLPASQLRWMLSGIDSYADMAQAVLERMVDVSQVPPGVLREMIDRAYIESRWSTGKGETCPVRPLPDGGERSDESPHTLYQCELFHGPTAAFKDCALQLFPQLFAAAALHHRMEAMESGTPLAASKYMILAATSGDTGVAAIRGIQLGAPDVKIMVLYPEHGVSPVQRQQMLACNGGNMKVVGVESDFDFCQGTVKKVFNSKEIAADLASKYGTVLSSANSINWGRLLPQLVYYFWAYNRLVRAGRIALPADAATPLPQIDVCVPTGNFGNILSGYFAKRIGLPVRRFVLASNCNDVLTEFVRTGVYDLTERTLHVTASPSIDILRASNLERLLFYLSDYNGATVRTLMSELDEAKRFKVDAALHARVAADFTAYSCDEATCAAEIRATWAATRDSTLVLPDPHTAVAIRAARMELATRSGAPDTTPLVVLSTAHWAKFPQPVLRAVAPDVSGQIDAAGTKNEVLGLFDAVRAACPGTWVAQPLVEAFAAKSAGVLVPALEGFPADTDAIISEMMAFAAAQ